MRPSRGKADSIQVGEDAVARREALGRDVSGEGRESREQHRPGDRSTEAERRLLRQRAGLGKCQGQRVWRV